jgi:hypothetical protein
MGYITCSDQPGQKRQSPGIAQPGGTNRNWYAQDIAMHKATENDMDSSAFSATGIQSISESSRGNTTIMCFITFSLIRFLIAERRQSYYDGAILLNKPIRTHQGMRRAIIEEGV